MTERKIAIRNNSLPGNPRVFDVIVNMRGDILRFVVKNIKGICFVDMTDIREQIEKALNTN